MPVSEDGYVSFRGSQRRDFGELTHPRPVILVDVADWAGGVLRLPAAFASQKGGTVLLRLPDYLRKPDELPTPVANSLEHWTSVLRVALLTHPLGAPPAIETIAGPELADEEARDLLDRARAVELEALLEFGQAIWRPTTFHYRLITGEHADAYIKLGDAIRQARDADVLASWLHPRVKAGIGLILDTGTLTPVAQSLRLAARREELELGPVSTLDNYPRTVLDVGTILDRAGGDAGQVLILVSVSSSGALLDRIRGAVARKGESMRSHVSVLVNKGGEAGLEGVEVWTPLAGQPPLVASGAPDEVGCKLCHRPGRAAVVPINPFTFDAMLPTQLRLVVPDIDDPAANRTLWEAAQRNEALSVERAAHQALRRYRSDKVPMGIKLEAAKLIGDETFRKDLRQKLRGLRDEKDLPLDSDLVLAPEHEAEYPGYEQFWDSIRQAVAPDVERVTPFPIDEPFDAELTETVRAADNILVFQLGAVSGASIQKALVGVQHAKEGDDKFKLSAFVLHARPATQRELSTIRNSYGHRGKQPQMRFAWSSILPDRSPLREERVLLRSVDLESLSREGESFVSRRLELCGGKYMGSEPPLVLWGSNPGSQLTPNSIYGRDLSPVTTYVAVGSAMSAALGVPERMNPELHVFEVAAIARSYYDPLILGCMLRWMRPHEAFWGWTAAEAEATALHMLDRAESLGQDILVPEMLLAAAQGKLTKEAAKVAVRVAEGLVDEGSVSVDIAAILEVGLLLVRDAEELPPTEGIYRPEQMEVRQPR